jgi:hypothetical protein
MQYQDFPILKYVYRALLCILTVPMIQGTFSVFNEKPLNGAIVKKQNPVLTELDWIAGDYQIEKETYLNESFGFRPFFVRLHNQLDYMLFDKLHANSVIRGKNNYLFEINYIKAYYGDDFIGYDSIKTRMHKLKKIQDSLDSKNKSLILVFASSKGQYYPEYFPDSLIFKKSVTNYEVHLQLAKELGIRYIDFNSYFLDNKNTTAYPLYPKYGIHWSYYGACLVADSLIHYIENLRKIDMPELEWNTIETDQPRFDDNDIEKGLNLLFSLKGPDMAYPQIYWKEETGNSKPKVMVIADSYYWTLFNMGVSNAFAENPFWYYYSEVHTPGQKYPQPANQVLLKQALRTQDVYVILSTDANLTNLGWGFVEWTSRLVDNNEYMNLDFEERVENLKNYIPTDSAWIKDIRMKAKERGIPVDSMITLDAIWMIEQESKPK